MSVDSRLASRAEPALPSAPTKSSRPFRADIQGLRAVAVVLVLLEHAGLPFTPGGFVGVDVFFVISGFLISGHLVESLRHTGRIDFVGFYAARARRILPAALVTIVATAAAAFVLVSPLRIVEILQDAVASALSVPNLLFAVRETDYLAGTAPSPFQHFWSLGVEEQFYIVWPVLLLAVFLIARRSRRVLMAVIGAVTVASFIACVMTTSDAQSLAFFSPHTRAWEFGVGALIAGGGALLTRVPAAVAGALTWAGLAAILLAVLTYSAELAYPGVAVLLPVLGAALVIGFGGNRGTHGAGATGGGGAGGAASLLARRPVQFVGAISYSLYLVHWPILVLTHEHLGLGEPLPLPVGLALVVASVPVAWLLFRFVESPFRTGRSSPRAVLVLALTVTVVMVTCLSVGGAAAIRLPLSSDRVEQQSPASELPTGTAFVPANVVPTLAAAVEDTGVIYTDGCQQNKSRSAVVTCSFGAVDSPRTIALFGDSHAGRWFPALDRAAASLDYRLDTYTKSGCRSEETVAAWNSTDNPSCSLWRDDTVARLMADPPDVIVLANHLGPQPGRNAAVMEDHWTTGLSAVLDRLPTSSLVVILADSPEFTSSPVLCLSSHLDDADGCSTPRSTALNPAIRDAQRTAAAQHGAVVIDLTDFLCNESTCPAVIGRTLVYSDEHHLTATFSQTLAPAITQRLAPYLDRIR
ncbi:acyltransferase family protein [Leifsonia sp. YIM 134122]|uniref:Acyltransferase family protein n=1 Tax=Leifsonia stereocauli TaxID=3134136 RepID=A0ABU9VZI8_9MICO